MDVDADFEKMRLEMESKISARKKVSDEQVLSERLVPVSSIDTKNILSQFQRKSIFSFKNFKYTMVLTVVCFILNLVLTLIIYGFSKGIIAPIVLNVCTIATFDLTYRYQEEMYQKFASKLKSFIG